MIIVWQTVQKHEAEAAASGRDVESRLSEVEERLKETEHERDSYKDVCWVECACSVWT